MLTGRTDGRRFLEAGLTKERHTGRVYGFEFGQVLLEVVLAQLHGLLQDSLLPLWYRLEEEEAGRRRRRMRRSRQSM